LVLPSPCTAVVSQLGDKDVRAQSLFCGSRFRLQ
jgi:hypothetical protein